MTTITTQPELPTAQTAVFEALGAASTCWENMSGTGVFDDSRAKQIGEDLLHQLGLPHANFDPERDLSAADYAALQRFTSPNFAVRDLRGGEAERFRRLFYNAALGIILAAKPTKSRAVALTELETAMMWAIKAYYGAPGE